MKFHYQVSFLIAFTDGQSSYHDRTVTCDRPLDPGTLEEMRGNLAKHAAPRRKTTAVVILNIFELAPPALSPKQS